MRVFTIGFTKKPARRFFELLGSSGAVRLVDVRLNNSSQLAGFAKQDDLAYFLETICGMGYVHLPDLAPTAELLTEYRKNGGDWASYEMAFLSLMATRSVQDQVPRDLVDDGCLLCSEDKPDRCHRRLVAEYLQTHWGDVEIIHLT